MVKINLNDQERAVLISLLCDTGVSCKFLNTMTNEQLVEGVLFYFNNKKVVDTMNKLLPQHPKKKKCSCNIDKIGTNDIDLELIVSKEQAVHVLLMEFEEVPEDGTIKIGIFSAKLAPAEVLFINLNHEKRQ